MSGSAPTDQVVSAVPGHRAGRVCPRPGRGDRWGTYPPTASPRGPLHTVAPQRRCRSRRRWTTQRSGAEPATPTRGQFTADRARDAALFAAGAAAAVGLALRPAAQVALNEQLRTVLTPRAVIDQVIGTAYETAAAPRGGVRPCGSRPSTATSDRTPSPPNSWRRRCAPPSPTATNKQSTAGPLIRCGRHPRPSCPKSPAATV